MSRPTYAYTHVDVFGHPRTRLIVRRRQVVFQLASALRPGLWVNSVSLSRMTGYLALREWRREPGNVVRSTLRGG